MIIDTIDKLDFTLDEWKEILGVCELVLGGLLEIYCQRKLTAKIPD